MRLPHQNVNLFFAVTPAFIASLPPAPDRDEDPVNDGTLALNNAIISLRFEITRLLITLTEERASVELSESDYAEASPALEDILEMLNSLVDDSVPRSKEALHIFPKLVSLNKAIICLNPALGFDASQTVPLEVSNYISFNNPGGHIAAQYRRSAQEARRFNSTIDRVFSHHTDITKQEATEVFYRDRDNKVDELESDKCDLKEIHAAKKLCRASKVISQIMTNSTCQKPHSAYIKLSGFSEAQIFTIITMCHTGSKWRAVQWTSTDTHCTTDQALRAEICDELTRRHRPKTMLHIRVGSDGSWQTHKPAASTPTHHPEPPQATLEELLIPNRALEKGTKLKKADRLSLAVKLGVSLLCLLGSPLLQGSWNSESMRCEAGDIFSLGHFQREVNYDLTASDNRSFILGFGALLWELFFQQKVDIMDDDIEDEGSDDDSLFNALNREVETWGDRCVDAACLDIVSKCLDLWCEDGDEDELRASMHAQVLRPLREYSSSYNPPQSTNDAARVLFSQTLPQLRPSHDHGPVPLPGPVPRKDNLARIRLQDPYIVQQAAMSKTTPCTQASSLLVTTKGTITESLSWVTEFQCAHDHLASLSKGPSSKPVRVAILDTGCDINDHYFCGVGVDRVEDWEGLWHDCLGESSEPLDEDKGRHGTAVACLLLQLAPKSEIFVVRIAKDSSGLSEAHQAIAEAILLAVKSWEVDIISMSFGFRNEVEQIKDAILEAERWNGHRILFFAAANNDGLNEPEMFPAFHESVISVRGTKHNGEFVQQYNPRSWSYKSAIRYGTLAQDVPYAFSKAGPTASGCSIATPILAAIAAVVISFADSQGDWSKEREDIRTRRGMTAVFNLMAEGQESPIGRHYLAPWQLYENRKQPRYLIGHALSMIP
ncbi:serine protease [Fusarium austroafricanum]|uniref:Serine protease n=1 Tax=Fusarium austroafricanum TaxID=2364996 RepID=A0A8H4KCZ2_9HYPO|nr:serine protease [Fusarium austroafricanum]